MTGNTHPRHHAVQTPDKPAVIMAGSGTTITYAQLEAGSNRGAQLFRKLGLRPGDHIAVMLENHPLFYEVFWASQRAGLYFKPISTHLTAEEAAYIARDCGARLVVASQAVAEVAAQLPRLVPQVEHFLALGAVVGYQSWTEETQRMPEIGRASCRERVFQPV
jgi:fatty-acyl-CoA synthase